MGVASLDVPHGFVCRVPALPARSSIVIPAIRYADRQACEAARRASTVASPGCARLAMRIRALEEEAVNA